MKSKLFRATCRGVMASLLCVLAASPAWAQSAAPSSNLSRLIVPFPPGGSTDAAARILAEGLTTELKHPVIVDNKPGAGTTIAAAHVASSAPDGTTLLITGPISHVTSSALYPRLKYDAQRGFLPVAQIASAPFLIVVRSDSRYRNLADLIQAAKASPGRLSYGSSGMGATPHLVGEMLSTLVGAKFLHVPYRGAAPATVGLLSGEVDFSVSDASAIPHLSAGKLRALAVTTARRSALAPDVPSVAEAIGVDLDEGSGIAVFAPAGTPAETMETLSKAVAKIVAQESVAKRLAAQGMEVAFVPSKPLGDTMSSLHRRYGPLIQRLGIKLE